MERYFPALRTVLAQLESSIAFILRSVGRIVPGHADRTCQDDLIIFCHDEKLLYIYLVTLSHGKQAVNERKGALIPHPAVPEFF
jgi:hypothetical protein